MLQAHARSQGTGHLRVVPRTPKPIPQGGKPHSARSIGPPDGFWLGLAIAIPVAATLWGLPYYVAAVATRVRSPLHPLLKPSGLVGQSFGIAGLALFLFMWLYPMRKKLPWLSFTGSLGDWMRVHAVIGIALPLLVAVHAAWRFRGLIGLGYAAMVLVSLSGLVGRYLYTRIPRSRNGIELSRDEATSQRRSLVTEIAAALALDPAEVERALAVALEVRGGGGVLGRMVGDDFARWRAVRALRQRWSRRAPGAPQVDGKTIARALTLARREIALGQQLALLDRTQRLLRYWHVAHRPVAITALLAVTVHVVVAVVMGQTWLR
jgi:hypothetical protein